MADPYLHISVGNKHYTTPGRFANILLDSAEISIKNYDEKNPYISVIPAIILSFAALESYVNMYSILFIENNDKKEEKNQIEPANKQLLGEEKTPIEDKLLIWTKLMTGKTFDKGKEPWQSFDKMKKIRNEIVHFKIKKDTSEIPDTIPVIQEIIKKDLYDSSLLSELTLENAKKSYNVVKNVIIELQKFMDWPILEWMEKKL